MAKKFTIDDEIKLLKKFQNVCCGFEQAENSINEDEALKGIEVIDKANVGMCIGISEEAKRFISRFKDVESEKKNIKLDYKTNKNEIPKSSYSIDMFLSIIEFLKFTDDKVILTMKKDYPITIENQHFKFILAPRIEAEGNEI